MGELARQNALRAGELQKAALLYVACGYAVLALYLWMGPRRNAFVQQEKAG